MGWALLGFAPLLDFAPASAWELQTIYAFAGTPDGSNPHAGVVRDSQGRLYGTAFNGGVGAGTVFRLTPPVSGVGAWTEETLHSFTGPDGANPSGPVVLGSDGSVYGTTQNGGPYQTSLRQGRGEVFELANTPGWPLTVLHAFNRSESAFPAGDLVFGPDGLLYGSTPSFFTTSSSGTLTNNGSVFSVSPLGDKVEYSVLHTFGLNGDDAGVAGIIPVPPQYYNGLAGSADVGGTSNLGTVFALELEPNLRAKESYVYSFAPQPDVSFPESAPLVGQFVLRGGFFGCAGQGGTHNLGGIYSLAANGKSPVSENVLYSFGDQAGDPIPAAGSFQCDLVEPNGSGVLYGTSEGGGTSNEGAFFQLDPPAVSGGAWTEKVDYSFGPPSLGYYNNPMGTLLPDGRNFYGAASSPSENGVIYELTP